MQHSVDCVKSAALLLRCADGGGENARRLHLLPVSEIYTSQWFETICSFGKLTVNTLPLEFVT